MRGTPEDGSAETGGLHDLALDPAGRKIIVTYEPAEGRLDAYVAAINQLGHEAKLASAK